MCGRYALALRPSQIRRMLQDNYDMPVDDAPEDEGQGAPRQSYNFAPGYHGVVYRADVPDHGAGPHRARPAGKRTGDQTDGSAEAPSSSAAVESEDTEDIDTTVSPSQNDKTHYKLQSMKWGLIPFWTKRNPDYASVMKTINCRDDSLATPGGMWQTMKARKRCIVVAEGFFEWLKTGPKERVPHYIKRKDGKLLLLAGLWDCVQYEDDDEASKNYTYTIITTDSNKQLKFLHDRMPVILEPGSEELRTWLDPGRHEWSKELGDLLKPFEGELEVYVVSKEMNKVGNSSPSFIVPVASKENKKNIANFFANAQKKNDNKLKAEVEVKAEPSQSQGHTERKTLDEVARGADDGGMKSGIKREAEDSLQSSLEKKPKVSSSPAKASPAKAAGRQKISATKNGTEAATANTSGSQKITKFFSNPS